MEKDIAVIFGILKWEELKTDGEVRIWRAKVFRGWLVGSGNNPYTFVPDDYHVWSPKLQ
jgi:hypothetical protein